MSAQSHYLDEALHHISTEARTYLNGLFRHRTYDKGQFLLREQSVCRYCFIIQEGMARKFYPTADKELTMELFFPNDIALSVESYYRQQPSKEAIQALSPLTCLQIGFAEFQEACRLFPELMQLDLVIATQYTIWQENRFFDYRSMNATDRYMQLLDRHPEYIQQLPLTIIASYLGISLETLSRIRARI